MGHHYAPRKYLLGFCEPQAASWLWVYDRKYKQFKRKHVGGVAQEKGFYTDEDEAELNRVVETPANPVLDKLRAGGSMTDRERMKLAVYIATAIYRVPCSRLLLQEAAPSIFHQTVEFARQSILRQGKQMNIAPERIKRRLKELDEYRAKHADNPAGLIPERIRNPWPSKQVCRMVLAMTWRLLETGSGGPKGWCWPSKRWTPRAAGASRSTQATSSRTRLSGRCSRELAVRGLPGCLRGRMARRHKWLGTDAGIVDRTTLTDG
jgi:hypothetical protein